MHKIFAAALLPALCAPALAAPAEMASAIKADKPYGEGAVRVLFLTAYDAQYWTDAKGWSMDAPFALKLSYGMGFSAAELVARTKKEMRHVAPALDDAAIDAYGAELRRVFPDVKKGDAITALYRPGRPVMFFLNGKPTGSVADAGFAAPFFGIWLSPATSDPGLRAKLLHLS
jgi:hypothetical protein